MKSTYLPWAILVGAVALFSAHRFFNSVHLYFLLWWLDIPMHVLSGLFVSLAILYITFHEKLVNTKDSSVLFVVAVAVAGALTIGLFWEIYGFVFGHTAPTFGGALFDTLKDLFDDLFGGLLAAFIFLGKGYNRKI